MLYCVMVKGKCRGSNCDFWARIRVRKKSDSELISDIMMKIKRCKEGNHQDLDSAFEEFWKEIGIKNMKHLCREEPELCDKIRRIELAVANQIG